MRSAGFELAGIERPARLPRGHFSGTESAEIMAVAAEAGPGGDDRQRNAHGPGGFGPGEHELRERRGIRFGTGGATLRFVQGR